MWSRYCRGSNPTTQNSAKGHYLSRQTWDLIDVRQCKYEAGDHEAVCKLNSKMKSSAWMDRSRTSNSNEDPHDHQPEKLWKVVSYLRKDFKPNRNAIGDTEGRRCHSKTGLKQ